MSNCPNPYIKNPVFVLAIEGRYTEFFGWIDSKPNGLGLVRFCSSTGKHPYHYVAPSHYFKKV